MVQMTAFLPSRHELSTQPGVSPATFQWKTFCEKHAAFSQEAVQGWFEFSFPFCLVKQVKKLVARPGGFVLINI